MVVVNRIFIVLAFAAPHLAISQSVKSCGGPNDHLKDVVIKLTPDPIKKGGTLTIQTSGTLDEDLTGATSNLQLTVKAFGIVHASVSGAFPISISPAVAKGPFSLTVGPMTLPSGIPGSATVKGQVHVVNAKNEPVLCLDLDVDVPATDEVAARPPLNVSAGSPTPSLQAITSCGKATDHIPDFSIATTSGVTSVTGTLDEAVTKASLDVDVAVKVLFISVPLKMTIPVTASPGITRGAIKASAGPSSIVTSPNVEATVKGTVKVSDGNGEEITCLNVDTVVAASDTFVV